MAPVVPTVHVIPMVSYDSFGSNDLFRMYSLVPMDSMDPVVCIVLAVPMDSMVPVVCIALLVPMISLVPVVPIIPLVPVVPIIHLVPVGLMVPMHYRNVPI